MHGKLILSKYLIVLFNKIFELGYFPKACSQGFVEPLHKKGNLNNDFFIEV